MKKARLDDIRLCWKHSRMMQTGLFFVIAIVVTYKVKRYLQSL